MISRFMGIEYGNGACAVPHTTGVSPAGAPGVIKKMFPNVQWTMVTPEPSTLATCMANRFAENAPVQKMIYENTTDLRHIMIGGDHSVNFGHFAALADHMPDTDLCMVYIDAHFDIHNPTTSRIQATGAPHGCNVRALMGDGDERWMNLIKHTTLLKPENIFYIGVRSFEPAEAEFVNTQHIFVRYANQLQTTNDVQRTVESVRQQIANRPFVLSFDFDSIDPKFFPDVLVPACGGISVDTAKYMVESFADANFFEFVEYAPNGDGASADIVRTLITIAMNS